MSAPRVLEIFDKSPCNRASVFIVQMLEDDADEQDFEDPVEYEKLSAWFKDHPISKRMKRGDVLHNISMGDYRNDGKFIFDGEKLCYPYNSLETVTDDPDEYGYVPRSFLAINEFPVRYWSEIIDHNTYIYADLTEIVDQIKWHTPFGNNQELYLGTFTPPATLLSPQPQLHAIISETKEVPRGISLYSYDTYAVEDMLDGSLSMTKVLSDLGVNPENVITTKITFE